LLWNWGRGAIISGTRGITDYSSKFGPLGEPAPPPKATPPARGSPAPTPSSTRPSRRLHRGQRPLERSSTGRAHNPNTPSPRDPASGLRSRPAPTPRLRHSRRPTLDADQRRNLAKSLTVE